MVTHATDQGVAAMAAASVLGVSGLASIAGRVGGGLLADRFGAKPTLIAGLAVQAAMIFGYLFARDLGSFVALALVFGTAYGGVMPLYALVVREYFGEKVMGSAYGAVFLISTLGMGLGSFAGGAIYDRLGSYAWLFLASAAIGTMAVVLAFTFRRPTGMGGPEMAPHTPRRSSRPGEAVARLDLPTDSYAAGRRPIAISSNRRRYTPSSATWKASASPWAWPRCSERYVLRPSIARG